MGTDGLVVNSIGYKYPGSGSPSRMDLAKKSGDTVVAGAGCMPTHVAARLYLGLTPNRRECAAPLIDVNKIDKLHTFHVLDILITILERIQQEFFNCVISNVELIKKLDLKWKVTKSG